MVAKTEQTVNNLITEIADAKRLPIDFLLRFARPCDDGSLLIRYGEAYRPRYRGAAAAKHGSHWATNGKAGQRPIGPYGPGVGQYKGSVRIVVEGESDCWALWFHSFPALGVPGATMAHVLAGEHFAGVSRVYIHREPDAAGEAFVTSVAKRLRKIGYAGEILRFTCGEHKDPADMHAAIADDGQGGFRDSFESLLEAAVPVDEPQQATSGGKHQHGGQCGCGGCQGHATHQHAASGGKLDVEAIRQQLELVDLRAMIARDLGPQAKGGKWYCPFHSDCNNPNLSVSPNGQRWVCWACGAKGDAIDWLRERRGMSFVEAAAELGIQVPLGGWIDDYTPEWVEATDDDKRWDEILEAAFGGDCPELSKEGNPKTDKSGHNGGEASQPPRLPEFSVSDCRRNGGVVQRSTASENGHRVVYACRPNGEVVQQAVTSGDGGHRIVYAPCRCRSCQGCGPVWDARRIKWYGWCLANEPNPLFVLECKRDDWATVRKRIARHAPEGGPRYLAIETSPNWLTVLTTSPVVDAEPINKPAAISVMTDGVYGARPVKTPIMQCKEWRLPTKEAKPADPEWQTVARFCRVTPQQKREIAELLRQAKARTLEIQAADDSHAQVQWQVPRGCDLLAEAALLNDVLEKLGVDEPPPDGEGDLT